MGRLFTGGGDRLVEGRNRRKLRFHPFPTHIIGARGEDGRRGAVGCCGVVVDCAAPAKLDRITGGSIRLLDAVAEEPGAVGRLVARHLLRGENYGCRVLVRRLLLLRELELTLNASSGNIAFNAIGTATANRATAPNAPAIV